MKLYNISFFYFALFILLYLINYFLPTFYFHVLFKHIFNHTKLLQLNLIHSYVYIGMHFHLYIFITVF